eukprot:GHVS01044908.1.p1 GENE.GHVS01044908.1~~GHVS01044908.1.p1  ORF type:complete len:483 (+),score=63.40 GHVS01044908.1:94-1542(+)
MKMEDLDRLTDYWKYEECSTGICQTRLQNSTDRRSTRVESTVSPRHEYCSESFALNNSLFDSSPSSLSSRYQSPDKSARQLTGATDIPPSTNNHVINDEGKETTTTSGAEAFSSGVSTVSTSGSWCRGCIEVERLAEDAQTGWDVSDSTGSRQQDTISEEIKSPDVTLGNAILQAVQQGDGEALLKIHEQTPVPLWKDGQIYHPITAEPSSTHVHEQGGSWWSRLDQLRRDASDPSRKQEDGREGQRLQSSRDATVFDALVIPSGGIDLDGQPNMWTRERLDVAAELHSAGHFLICLSRATPHKPVVIDDNSHPLDEAHCMSRYLVEVKGVDPGRILCESWSRDTIGNAFACKQLLCGPLGLRKLLVINSLFHLPRTRILFDWIFHLPDKVSYRIDYLAVPNHGLSDAQVKARWSREQRSIQLLIQERIPRLRTLPEVADFVFREHKQYASWSPPPAAGDGVFPVLGDAAVCCQHSEVFATY